MKHLINVRKIIVIILLFFSFFTSYSKSYYFNGVKNYYKSNETLQIGDSLKAEPGKIIQITGVNEIGYIFNHWTLNGVFLSSMITYEFIMPSNDVYIIGHFDKIEKIFQITSPIKESKFPLGVPIIITVDIPDINKPISRVEYFLINLKKGNVRIGTSNSIPYSFKWVNASRGTHTLVAKLFYMDGTSISSSPISITVLRKNNTNFKLLNGREVVNLDIISNDIDPFIIIDKDNKVNNAGNGKLEYTIMPNPSSEYIKVVFTNLGGASVIEFKIISMSGIVKTTFHAMPEMSTVNINVSDFKTGVYILQLITDKNIVSTRKFIKK